VNDGKLHALRPLVVFGGPVGALVEFVFGFGAVVVLPGIFEECLAGVVVFLLGGDFVGLDFVELVDFGGAALFVVFVATVVVVFVFGEGFPVVVGVFVSLPLPAPSTTNTATQSKLSAKILFISSLITASTLTRQNFFNSR